eukprot:5222832-Pyramimonas_sp.AAC.1
MEYESDVSQGDAAALASASPSAAPNPRSASMGVELLQPPRGKDRQNAIVILRDCVWKVPGVVQITLCDGALREHPEFKRVVVGSAHRLKEQE